MLGNCLHEDRQPFASLLFERGARPSVECLHALAGRGDFAVCHDLGGPVVTAEVARSGLTFDLAGLAPGNASGNPLGLYHFALPGKARQAPCEAVALLPGPHLAGGQHMLPAVQVAAGLLAELTVLPGILAVSWGPATNLVGPDWFAKNVLSWLNGGPFPVFALVSLVRRRDGSIASKGLNFLSGYELRLEPSGGRGGLGGVVPGAASGAISSDAMPIAIRLLDWLMLQRQTARNCTAVIPGVGVVHFELDDEGYMRARQG